jgi:hypothetical protein
VKAGFNAPVHQVAGRDVNVTYFGPTIPGPDPDAPGQATRDCPQCTALTWAYNTHCHHCQLDMRAFDRRKAWRAMNVAKYFLGGLVIMGAVAFAAKAHGVELAAAARPVVAHNYDFKEGIEYGYTMNQAPGEAARQVATFLYAGARDGRYQLHSRQGSYITAIECTVPCDVAKVITALDHPSAQPGSANVRRLRLDRNSVGYRALQDAAAGQLRQYGEDIGGKPYTVWVDPERGVVRTRATKK